jgi:hypothetical protein
MIEEDVVETERASPLFQQPRIHTASVELVTTRQKADTLFQAETLQTYRTRGAISVPQIRQGFHVPQFLHLKRANGRFHQFLYGTGAGAGQQATFAAPQLNEHNGD